MANETTASTVQYLGHGARTTQVFHSVGRPIGALLAFCLVNSIDSGYASNGITLLGAALTAAVQTETGAAASNQALPAPTQVLLTPTTKVATVAPTTAALHRVDPALADLPELLIDECQSAHAQYSVYDASAGVAAYHFTQLSTRVGTSGSALTPQTLLDAYRTLQTQVGMAGVHAIAWLDLKGVADLQSWGLGTASSLLGSQVGANKLFLDLLTRLGVETLGYQTSWGNLHIFCDPNPTALATVSGDKIGACFIPHIPGLNGLPLPDEMQGMAAEMAALATSLPGKFSLAPAWGVGYRKQPGQAAWLAAGQSPLNREVVMDSGIPLRVVPRGPSGQNILIMDTFSESITVEVSDSSGVGVRYVA